jgi:hypothetical protein
MWKLNMMSDFLYKRTKIRLGRLLEGNISHEEFFNWFYPATFGKKVEKYDQKTKDFVYGITLFHDEYTGGYMTKKELYGKLEGLLKT